jgi:hypothetical protein
VATTTYFVKKIGVMSIAKFGALIGMIIGIINGIILAMNIGPSAAIAGRSMFPGVGSGVMTFSLNVILWIIFGFLGGTVIAFIYNFEPGEMGGIEVGLVVRQ